MAVIRDHSWLFSGNHIRWWGPNLGMPHAKQAPYMLFCLSSSKEGFEAAASQIASYFQNIQMTHLKGVTGENLLKSLGVSWAKKS